MRDRAVDRIAKGLARGRYSRRTTLRTGGIGAAATLLSVIGVGSAGIAPAKASQAATATPTDAVKTENGWLCQQKYAICTTAPCERDPSDDKTVNCRCLVEDGYSFGFTACNDRVPVGDSVTSTFSTQDVTSSFHELSCPDGSAWANCLDMPCQIDPADPKKATCQCEVVETGAFVTMGGDCDTSTCASVIWSGNTSNSPVVPQYTAAMKQLDQQITLPQDCPSASATPAST